MRATATKEGTGTSVGVRTACVLADRQVWSSALGDALEALGYDVQSCPDLNSLFETVREVNAGLVVVAVQDPAGAVRACRVTPGLVDVPLMVVMPRERSSGSATFPIPGMRRMGSGARNAASHPGRT